MPLLLSALACGLPSFPSLGKPPVSPDDIPIQQEKQFRFTIPVENDPNVFEGFELYYRLYSSSEVAGGAHEDDATTLRDRTSARQAGYRRMLSAQYTQNGIEGFPLLPLENDEKTDPTLAVTIDFSTTPSNGFPEASLIDTATETTIRTYAPGRDASATGEAKERKAFAPSSIHAEDGDIPTGYDPEGDVGATLYVSLFAFSYGNNYSPPLQFNIYSESSYLGIIQLQLIN